MHYKTIALTISKFTRIELTLWALSVAIPFFISGPQILTGSVINCLLLLGATRLTKKSLLILAVMPSISALAHNLVFGGQTIFLFYFLPFIWISNLIYIYSFTKMNTITNSWFSLIISAILKTIVLYFVANVFYKLAIAPIIFLSAMGYFQLITAIIGGVIAIQILKLRKTNV